MSFDIGGYVIDGGVLAPMAGYTDIAFRQLAREYGAALTVTEMVSARGIVHGNAATRELTRLAPDEHPSCVQLFGNDPDDFARAADAVDCDIIDINMGCPMPKITGNGDGAALLKTPELAGKIVRAIKRVTDRPVTVKTRIGYDMGAPIAAELVKCVADAGAAAVYVHGRYAMQRYAGRAEYGYIADIARGADIPVVVNGDMTAVTPPLPFAGVMIGRAALSDPALFCGGSARPTEYARRHIALLRRYFDDRYTVFACRKFFVHYFKGVRGGKTLRDGVNRAASPDEVLRLLDAFERKEPE